MTIAIERVELHPQDFRGTHDQQLAEIVGVTTEEMSELMVTRVVDLGHISVKGTNDEAPVLRFHCGPEGSVYRGGTKFKYYSSRELLRDDGIDHSRSMFYKIGGIAEIERAGGKTIAGVNPRALSRNQMIDAMRQYAGLMYEAGLADPTVDGTAGDEGTNGYIDHYVEALRELGHPHPETCITGKSDMAPRAAATGRGAAVVHRAHLRRTGLAHASTAVQGSGFAGAYYAAEAHEPYDNRDRDVSISIPAIGDLDPKTGRPATLFTEHADGLPITRKMVDGILKNGEADRDMQDEGGYKLAALARKIERESGREVHIVDKDVLTYEAADTLAPAATSNVFTPQNLGSVSIPTLLEIGNHTVRSDAQELLAPLGITLIPGELVNSGGVKMSIEENRRDLARVEAAKSGGLYLPVPDHEYELRLRETMVTATDRAMALGEKYRLDTALAIKAVALANYAVAHGVRINPDVHAMLAA